MLDKIGQNSQIPKARLAKNHILVNFRFKKLLKFQKLPLLQGKKWSFSKFQSPKISKFSILDISKVLKLQV